MVLLVVLGVLPIIADEEQSSTMKELEVLLQGEN
jgi:hypothetical protein